MAITIGFSIFLTRRDLLSRQKEMIIKGEDLGYSEIFFELGKGEILEALKYAKELLSISNKLEYYSFINVNPDILIQLRVSPANMGFFKQIGFSAVRLSQGFRIEDMLKIKDIGIEVNPLQFPIEKLEYFLDKIDDPERVKASYDYYPKGAGIKLSALIERSKPFANLDIPVAAFISVPSIKANSTIEELRDKSPIEAAKILLETRVINRVIIGDPYPTDKEIEELSSVKKGY